MISGKRFEMMMTLVLVVAGWGSYGWGQGPAEVMLDYVPQNCLYCVAVNDFDGVVDKMETYLEGIVPPFGEKIKSGLKGVLGQPEVFTGRVVIFNVPDTGGAMNMEPLLLVDMGDLNARMKNPQWSQPDEKGVWDISQGATVATALGPYVLLMKKGDNNRLLEMAGVMKQVKGGKSLAKLLGNRGAQMVSKKPIWVYSDLGVVGQTFGPMLKAGLEQAKAQAMGAQGQSANPMAANVGPIMDMYMAGLDKMFEEVQYVALSIDPRPKQVKLSLTVQAAAKSELAKLMAGSVEVEDALDYGKYLPEKAIFNLAGIWDAENLKKFYGMYWELLGKMMGGEEDGLDLDSLRDMTARWADMSGGHYGMSFFGEPGQTPAFGFISINEVKDKEGYLDLMTEYQEMMGGALGDFYKKMGLTIAFDLKEKTSRYRGVDVWGGTMKIGAADPESPQGQMIGKIYGKGLAFSWALVGDRYAAVMASDSLGRMKALIDQIKDEAGGNNGFEQTVKTLGKRRSYECGATFNIVEMIKMGMSIIPAEAGGGLSLEGLQSSSKIVMGSRTVGRKAILDMVIPKQHLQELMGGIGMLEAQQMQKKGQHQSQ